MAPTVLAFALSGHVSQRPPYGVPSSDRIRHIEADSGEGVRRMAASVGTLVWCHTFDDATGAAVALPHHPEAQLYCAPHRSMCAVQLHNVLVQQCNCCTSDGLATLQA